VVAAQLFESVTSTLIQRGLKMPSLLAIGEQFGGIVAVLSNGREATHI